MKIIVGNASKELGELIASELNVQLSPTQISNFADGEINVEAISDLSNQEVYIVQSISPPVNDNLMELLLIIDAVKRIGAKKITAIIPYYGYSRQDRVIRNNRLLSKLASGRQVLEAHGAENRSVSDIHEDLSTGATTQLPVEVEFQKKSTDMQSALSAKLVANLIQTAGTDRVAVIDLHSSQIEGFFNVPVANLSCLEVFIDLVQKENLAIVAPDVGAIGRARAFAKLLEEKYHIELSDKIVVVDKYREKAGTSQVMNIIGEVTDKNCVIVDDIVDSGGTLCNAALALKNNGAKSVVACITHGVLSGNATEKISSSVLDKLIITNTILHKFEKTDKIEVVSIASVLANFILETQGGKNAS